LDTKVAELREKNSVISMVEKELEDIREKQNNEV
jgi:hypothetical protein